MPKGDVQQASGVDYSGNEGMRHTVLSILLFLITFTLLIIMCADVLGCQGRKGGRVSQELGQVHRRKSINNDDKPYLIPEQRFVEYAEGG